MNGRFTKRQRDVYNSVLRVKNEATQLLRPGTLMADYHKEVGKIMESELIGLGLLDKNDVAKQDPEKPLYKKYFMHGTSHFLGLDEVQLAKFFISLVVVNIDIRLAEILKPTPERD